MLGDVVGSGEALRSLGGDQLDGLQLTDGGGPESIRTADCSGGYEDAGLALLGLGEDGIPELIVHKGSDGHGHDIDTPCNDDREDLAGGLL